MEKFRTLELAKQIYKNASKVKLSGAVKNQYERALLSVVLNLSEGSGKPTLKDRRKFYYTSYASLKEVRTILSLIDENQFDQEMDRLAAHIWKLAQNPGRLLHQSPATRYQ